MCEVPIGTTLLCTNIEKGGVKLDGKPYQELAIRQITNEKGFGS